MASKPPPGNSRFQSPTFGGLGVLPLRSAYTGPTIGPASAIERFRPDISRVAQANGVSTERVNEFLQFWEKNQLADLKMILSVVKTADNAIKLARFFFALRAWGFAVSEAVQIFVVVGGLRVPQILPFIESVLRNGTRLEAGLKAAKGTRDLLGYFLLGVSVYNHFSNSEYSQAAAKIYKFTMGKAVPWASAIDTLQSFLPAPTPQSATFFKVLRACDPIGLGGIGIDSLIIVVQGVVDRAMGKSFDEERLAKLVNRMKTGPTSFFVDIGESTTALDGLWEIVLMDSNDWQQVGRYTVSQLREFVLGTGASQNQVPPGAARRLP